jgi:hypothetical protein
VTYEANTANTTASNTNNWEYVGNTPIKWAQDNGITSQTIKYWDYSTTQYDFIAWGMGKVDVSGTLTPITPIYNAETSALAPQTVRVSAIVPNGTNKTWPAAVTGSNPVPANVSYTFEGKAKDLAQCYISDILTVKKSGAGQYGEVEGYNRPVTLKFRQLGTKVRIALYETVPGYSVKDVEFYSAAASNDASAAAAKIFTTTANQIFTEGKYYVYFPTMDKPNDPDNNQAHIAFEGDGDQSTTVEWTGLNYTIRESGESSADAIYLGRTSNTASFAGNEATNYYEVYLPNQTGTNLNLRVNYTLESIDGSGEQIIVKGATAQVPLIYTQWKPGYAYTYLFKISDKTNGHTGVYNPEHPDDTYINSDPAGLYPITFDAIVVNAEDKDYTQETITLVSTPSITTYQNGSKVVNNDEYTVLTPSGKITGEIYVTVNDGEATYQEVTKTAGESVKGLYTKPSSDYIPCAADAVAVDGTKYYKMLTPSLDGSALATLTSKVALYTVEDGTTEAQVIDALQYQEDDKGSYNFMGRNGVGLTQTTGDNVLTLTNSVTYGVDGNTITVGADQAAKFVPAAHTTYAFVYTKTVSNTTTDMYEPRAFSGTGTVYRYKMTAVGTAGDVQENTVYVKPTTGTYTQTIQSVFLGQGAGNLFTTTNGTDYNPATTDYAVTNTDYFYTVDNGAHYTAAHKVTYAEFAGATLYVKSGAYYVTKSEDKPKDGVAYYYRTGAGSDVDPYVYTYCVIYPEQTATTWFTVDTNDHEVVNENEIENMTYFDKYTKNNGVYYTKVIKIQ